MAFADEDLGQVLSGASAWIEGWTTSEDGNLHFRSEVITGHRHDAGAIPALIGGYGFLYEN